MMKKPHSRWRLRLILPLLIVISAPAIASPRLENLLEQGNEALQAGRFDRARQAFLTGREEAAGDDSVWRSRFAFYLGLTEQTEGRKPEAEARVAHLEMAARYYEEVLELRPDSAVTARNLALAYFEAAIAHQAMGDAEKAGGGFAKARHYADTKQRIEFAERLEKQDLWRGAADFWEEVVKQSPRSSEPHRKMMHLYLERQAPDVVPYLWEILDAGQAVRAVGGGLEALIAGGWETDTKIELLTLVASGLARQVGEPREFPTSAAGRQLEKLQADPDVGRGCRELRAVHAAGELTPDAFGWWRRQRAEDTEDPPHGVWPRDAFRELVRSLASWFRARREFAAADSYYRLALDFDRERVDLEAFEGLVMTTLEQARPGDEEKKIKRVIARQLGIASGEVPDEARFTADLGADRQDFYELVMAFEEEFDIEIPEGDAAKLSRVADAVAYIGDHTRQAIQERLAALNQEYEPHLFAGKADAYRRSLQNQIFDYHRTLGVLYGALGAWGDESTPASAIFQLHHARLAAAQLEQGEDLQRSAFTPEMANLLAFAYDQTGKLDQSREVRREAAARYRSIGDDESAAKLMQLDERSLPQAVRYNQRFLRDESIPDLGRTSPEVGRSQQEKLEENPTQNLEERIRNFEQGAIERDEETIRSLEEQELEEQELKKQKLEKQKLEKQKLEREQKSGGSGG